MYRLMQNYVQGDSHESFQCPLYIHVSLWSVVNPVLTLLDMINILPLMFLYDIVQ